MYNCENGIEVVTLMLTFISAMNVYRFLESNGYYIEPVN
jgi:hypothetical protein